MTALWGLLIGGIITLVSAGVVGSFSAGMLYLLKNCVDSSSFGSINQRVLSSEDVSTLNKGNIKFKREYPSFFLTTKGEDKITDKELNRRNKNFIREERIPGSVIYKDFIENGHAYRFEHKIIFKDKEGT
jgi:hypothetical protein